MKVLLAPTWELAQTVTADVTIEAEYGENVARGRLYTAAHHGAADTEFAGAHIGGTRSAPCYDRNLRDTGLEVRMLGGRIDTVLISHMDLDTLGGIMLLQGSPNYDTGGLLYSDKFWRVAEAVDTRGPHWLQSLCVRLVGADADRVAVQIRAFWAWSKANRLVANRTEITDVTDYVEKAAAVIGRILDEDTELLDMGRQFANEERTLDRRTFVATIERKFSVILRYAKTSAEFCNHIYEHDGAVADAVACWNEETGAITVSLANPIDGVSCRELVQRLWGPQAGGHDGIAGSPRGQVMTRADAHHAAIELLLTLRGAA